MMKNLSSPLSLLLQLAILVLLGIIAWNRIDPGTPLDDEPYVAVLLTGGTAYYGKVERATRDYLILNDTYYIRRGQNNETGETTNVLIKRGQELHGPTGMIIPIVNIQFVEPVAPDSQIGKKLRGDE